MWTSTTALWLLLGAATPPPVPPGHPAAAAQADEADLDGIFVRLQDEYDAAYGKWRTLYREAAAKQRAARATNPEAKFEGPEPIEPTYFPQFDRLAQAGHANAALWCIQNHAVDLQGDAKVRDFTHRAARYMTHGAADIASLARSVSRASGSRGFLDPRTGRSILGLAETLAVEPEVKAMAAYYSAGLAGVGIDATDAALKARIEATRAVAKAYPETPSGKRAAGFVFSNEKLQLGMVAPDIVGADVDGNPMSLSDFRGKVTVIDFWGFW